MGIAPCNGVLSITAMEQYWLDGLPLPVESVVSPLPGSDGTRPVRSLAGLRSTLRLYAIALSDLPKLERTLHWPTHTWNTGHT